jgi:hypothetical protein
MQDGTKVVIISGEQQAIPGEADCAEKEYFQYRECRSDVAECELE